MGTLAIPILAAIVFATIYLAVPRLRERHETRRKWRAAERHLQVQQQTQRISFQATETTPSVDNYGWSAVDATPDERPLSPFQEAQEAFRAAWLSPGN